MTKRTGPTHVVVDGSNIATEGRSMPSLSQLNEAVLAFLEEFPGSTVTVVVDATFGHRIDKSEVKEFDAAVANNELVAPPAGAVGRGDAFVLSIANKAGATILSNDSFQEFHGEYDWLFEDGRLIGGKPVPHVGWVFVPRVPVRGPVSRKALRESRKPSSSRDGASGGRSRRGGEAAKKVARTASKEASLPMPVPTSPPPGRAPATAGDVVNELMPFLEFVEHHPVGTSVNAIVDTYSSHGAYVRIGDVRAYVPLRLMGDPPPRSAREVMKIGDAVTLVVASFAPARRSIDCALPHMAGAVERQESDEIIEAVAEAATQVPAKAGRRRAAAAAATATATSGTATGEAPAASAPAKKAAAKKAPAKKAPAKKAPAAAVTATEPAATEQPVTADGPAAPRPSRRRSAKQVAPTDVAVAEVVADGVTAAAEPAAPAKKAAAKKAAPAKKAAAKKAAPAAKKAAAKPAAAAKKQPAATKAAAKQQPAKRGAAKRPAAGAAAEAGASS